MVDYATTTDGRTVRMSPPTQEEVSEMLDAMRKIRLDMFKRDLDNPEFLATFKEAIAEHEERSRQARVCECHRELKEYPGEYRLKMLIRKTITEMRGDLMGPMGPPGPPGPAGPAGPPY